MKELRILVSFFEPVDPGSLPLELFLFANDIVKIRQDGQLLFPIQDIIPILLNGGLDRGEIGRKILFEREDVPKI